MVIGYSFLFSLFILASVGTPFADPTPVAANLDGIADWSRTLPFANLVKQARKFGTPNTPWDGNAPVDAKGFPTADFGVVLMDNEVGIGGDQLLVSGVFGAKPTIEGKACTVSVQNESWDPTSKKYSATVVVGPNESQVMLAFTGTNGGARSLFVLLPGYTETDHYTKEWLALLEKFVLFRNMDWGATNGNPIVNWSERITPDSATWINGPSGQTGVPYEIMVDLANTVGRDVWICVPHQANDDFVTNLAQVIKTNLNPSLNVYIEYSNEVWNWQFAQATWNLNVADASVGAGDPYHLNYDNCNNKWYWGYRRVALRLKQITDIFAQVWGKSAINSRVRPVLAGQVVQPLIAQLGLDYINAVYGPPNQWFHSIAGAPYFNLGDLNNNPNMTKDQVLMAMQQSVDSLSPSIGVGSNNFLAGHVALARWYGLDVRGYEGGPDTFGPNGIQAKSDASLDPKMKDIVVSYLRNWYSYGFGPLNWFVAGADSYNSQYGTWAITTDMHNLSEPKVQGVDAVRTSPPPPISVGILVPATLNATEFVGHHVPLTDPYLRYLSNGSVFDYIIRSSSAMSMQFMVYTSGTSASTLGININNKSNFILQTPNTGDFDTFQPTKAVTVAVDAGVNVVRLIVLANREYNIQAVVVK